MANSAAPAIEEHAAEVVPGASGRLLSRHEAARALGIRRQRSDGWRSMASSRSPGPPHLYEETVIQEAVRTKSVRRRWTEMPPTTDGGVAADVFGLLRQGTTPRDIVEQLRVSPELLAKLLSQWAALGAGIYIDADVAARLGVKTPADVAQVVESAASARRLPCSPARSAATAGSRRRRTARRARARRGRMRHEQVQVVRARDAWLTRGATV